MSFGGVQRDTNGTVQTYLKIEKNVIGPRTRYLFFCNFMIVAIVFIGSFSIAFAHPAPVAIMCSPMCVQPGVCLPDSTTCIPVIEDDTVVYCKNGWLGVDCVAPCPCGELVDPENNTTDYIQCAIDGKCDECAVGFTYDTVAESCTMCAAGYTTEMQGQYATCDFCETGYAYNSVGPTCTVCGAGHTTVDGPHQSTTCA